jgi:hypothetical protein
MTEEKDQKVTIAVLVSLLQELCHFTGQERILKKYGIPTLENAHKVDYRKK